MHTYSCAAHQPHWRCWFWTNLWGKHKIIHLQFDVQKKKKKNKVSSWNISLETQRFILLKVLKEKKVWYMRQALSGFDKITSLKMRCFFLNTFQRKTESQKYCIMYETIFFLHLMGRLTRWGVLIGLLLVHKEKLVEMTVNGSLCCSDHEMAEFEIQREAMHISRRIKPLVFTVLQLI